MTLPFPALVTSPSGEHWPLARPRFVGSRLQVFAYERGAVRLAADVETTATTSLHVERGRPARWSILDADGGEWIVEKGPGCGCGHPLKRANLDQIAERAPAPG